MIDCSSFLPKRYIWGIRKNEKQILVVHKMYYPCCVNPPYMYTHSVRLGFTFSLPPWQTAINLKRKISDTFAIMRNDGKLDNQTLHVLNVVFQICTTSCEWWEINKAFGFLAHLFNWKSRFFTWFSPLFSFKVRLSLCFLLCHIWRHKKHLDLIWRNIWSCRRWQKSEMISIEKALGLKFNKNLKLERKKPEVVSFVRKALSFFWKFN